MKKVVRNWKRLSAYEKFKYLGELNFCIYLLGALASMVFLPTEYMLYGVFGMLILFIIIHFVIEAFSLNQDRYDMSYYTRLEDKDEGQPEGEDDELKYFF